MKCIECASLDTHSHPAHAQIGTGRCRAQAVEAIFVSIKRDEPCAKFNAMPATALVHRVDRAIKNELMKLKEKR
jgi:hypothetical protein